MDKIPSKILRHVNLLRESFSINEEKIKILSKIIKSYDNIIICGTKENYITAQLSKLLSDFYINKSINILTPKTLVNYTPEWLDKKDLVIFLSPNAIDVIEIQAIKICKKNNCKIILLTNSINKGKKNTINFALKKYYKSEIIYLLRDLKKDNTLNFIAYLTLLNCIYIYYLQHQGLNIENLLKIQLLNLPILIEKLYCNKFLDKDLLEMKKKYSKNKIICIIGDGPRKIIAKRIINFNFNNIKSFLISNEDLNNLFKEKRNLDNFLFILLKPRSSQVNMNVMKDFEDVKKNIEKMKKENLIIIDPFKYVTANSIGTKTDIILSPLYSIVMDLLMKKINTKNDIIFNL